jgi:group I intron endonuclease
MGYTPIIGIYSIVSPSGKVYVGQSVNIKKRWADYRGLWNCSEQFKLYNSLKKYGHENHVFTILEVCDRESIDEREVFCMQKFDCLNKSVGLNIRGGGGNKIHSEETRLKISAANKGKKMSDESRLKMSISRKGRIPWNKGLLGSQEAWNKGKNHTPEHIENNRIANIRRKDSDDVRMKKSAAAKGKPKSKEHAAKVGLAHRGKYVSPETREKQRISRLNFLNKQQNAG